MGTQKGRQSRLSDSMMRTPEIGSTVSVKKIQKEENKKDQAYYNKIYSVPSKPLPKGHDEYFRKMKQRQSGIPIGVSLPSNIEV